MIIQYPILNMISVYKMKDNNISFNFNSTYLIL